MSAHDAGELRPGFEPATRRLLPNGSDFGNKAREWDRKAFLYDTRRKWDRHVNRGRLHWVAVRHASTAEA